MRLANLIDAFRPADGPPPETLRAFLAWCLKGALPVLAVAAALSAAAGTLEVVTALLLGQVIDTALASDPDSFFAEEWLLLLGFALFFVGLRPLVFGLSSAANSIVVGPNINPLVLSRLHRWTLGQSVTFFDDDFAGRIAQKQMQTARAVTEVTVETVNVVFFALASLIGSALLLTTIDWRIAVVLAVWLVAYIWMIAWFMPRVRVRSAARAGA
jgi:ATP-binding cassette subfamily B protein